jgi:hypothetical protein
LAEQGHSDSARAEMTSTVSTEPSPDWDKPIMLLSADWAVRFLPFIGIELHSKHLEATQQAARTAVTDFMGKKENYYYIDFNAERIAGTHSLFYSRLERSVPAPVVAHVEQRLAAILAPDERETTTTWLVSDAAQRLAADGGSLKPAVSPHITGVCRDCWNLSQEWFSGVLMDSDDACWTSATEWDKYLRSLTDLPSMLSDYLNVVVGSVGQLPLYWSLLKRRVDAAELDLLKTWFRNVAAHGAGQDLVLVFPAYMEMS